MKASMKKTLAAGSVTALVIGVLTLVILTLHSCGGSGSGNNAPIYDENGNCLENCGNGDGYVSSDNDPPSGDTSTYADGKPIPQPDTEPYVCPAKESAQEICFLDLKSKCLSTWDYDILCGSPEDGLNGKDCYCYGPYAYDEQTGSAKSCTTQKQCQQIPPDAWPPCVCWEFCGFLGEWDCGDGEIRKLSFLPDEGDGLCHFGEGSEALPGILGKPGDPNPRYPLEGEPETAYALSPDGQTLTSLTSMVTCTKL